MTKKEIKRATKQLEALGAIVTKEFGTSLSVVFSDGSQKLFNDIATVEDFVFEATR